MNHDVPEDPRRAQALLGLQFGLLGSLGLGLVSLPWLSDMTARLIGATLMLLGMAIIAIALRTFNEVTAALPRISPEPPAKGQLVTRGIYASIRHPIYTGVLTIASGLAALSGQGIMWLLLLGLLIVLYTKSHYEEDRLKTIFPEYDAYQDRTGRFLPNLLP